MSNDTYEDALNEAQKLARMNEDALMEQLGLRIKDQELPGGEERSQSFSGDFAQNAEDMGLSAAALREFGQRFWKKLEPRIMEMVCDKDNEEMKKLTKGKSIPQVAASLATAAVVTAWAAPAWVIVIASILALKLTETGQETLCEMWKESLEED